LNIDKEKLGMNRIQRFSADEHGFVVSSELILIATIFVIAMVVGLQTVRDGVLTGI
jgi:Flp pilus assembly pilin Flp